MPLPKVTVPLPVAALSAASTICDPVPPVRFALTAMEPAALNVSELAEVHVTAFETVILPVSPPVEPVETVTLAVFSALTKVVALIDAPVAVGTKLESLLSDVPMVTFHGSSSRLPILPCAASRLVVPA